MLGDVFTTVSDGLLGFSTNKGTGIFTAIGASPVKADRPVTITGNMGVLKIRSAPFSTLSMTESARGERPKSSRILRTRIWPVIVTGIFTAIGASPV